MKRILFSLLLLSIVLNVSASNDEPKNEVSFTAGLNSNDAIDAELSYHRLLCPYVAVGVGAGWYRQWYQDDYPYGEMRGGDFTSWSLSEDGRKVWKLYLNPNVSFRSPKLFSVRKAKINLVIEPGILMQIPHEKLNVELVNTYTQESKFKSVSTSKGKWCFFDLKVMLKAQLGEAAVAIGYGYSNLDIYTNYRKLSFDKVSFEDFYPKCKATQTLFLRLTYSL